MPTCGGKAIVPFLIGTAEARMIRWASRVSHSTAWARFVTKGDGGGILLASAALPIPAQPNIPIARQNKKPKNGRRGSSALRDFRLDTFDRTSTPVGFGGGCILIAE
jgi:hypothetical protein